MQLAVLITHSSLVIQILLLLCQMHYIMDYLLGAQ